MNNQTSQHERHKLHNLTLCAYWALLIGMLMQCTIDITIGMIGIVVMLAGIVIVYAKRNAVHKSYLQSHYRYMVRTFWIGGLILGLGMLVSAGLLVGMIDIDDLNRAAGSQDAVNDMLHGVMRDNLITLAVPQIPGIIWWIWRCIRGIRRLTKLQPAFPD